MKYPIGIQTFENIRQGGYVYVDKTALVYKMVNEGNIYFLSRPRRFGKSLLVSTLKAYFEGRKDLFEGLAIDSLESEWAKYPVLHFDFNGKNFEKSENALSECIDYQLRKYEDVYGSDPRNTALEERFKYLIDTAYRQTGKKCVVLIDEYDKPILDVLDMELEDVNRSILKGFYSTFKSSEASLRFVLLTGVTKFSQVSVFSGFNQPNDISMSSDYETLCGITTEELYETFAERLKDFAKKYRCSVDEIKQRLKDQYDGYHFSESMTDIYNPFSLLKAMSDLRLGDFWFATGTPSYLVRLLSHNNQNLNDLTKKYYEESMFADYKADVEAPLPMIYQSGYLTIKDYNYYDNSYLLDYPNNEVQKGFVSLVAAGYFKIKDNTLSSCREWSNLLRQGQTEDFVKGLTAFLASIPYDSHESLKDIESTEKHFQYTFYLLLRLIGSYCQVFNEKESSYGRCDCIIETNDYVYIIEFKLDGTADEALKQIEDKGYAVPYIADSRKIIKLGIVFSSETRTIGEWKM